MKNILQKIHAFFVKLHIVWFVLIMIASIFLLCNLILYPIAGLFPYEGQDPTSFLYSLPYWLNLTIFLPIVFLAVIICYWLVFKIYRLFKNFKFKNLIIVITCSLVFCIPVYYNISNLIISFFPGLLIGYSYIIAEEKKLSPVLIVTIIFYISFVIDYTIMYFFL